MPNREAAQGNNFHRYLCQSHIELAALYAGYRKETDWQMDRSADNLVDTAVFWHKETESTGLFAILETTDIPGEQGYCSPSCDG